MTTAAAHSDTNIKTFAAVASEARVEALSIIDSPIVVCYGEDNIADVLHRMIKQHILAVPVMNKVTQQWVNFIDLWDITRYIIKHFGRAHSDDKQAEVEEEEANFRQRTVGELLQKQSISPQNKFLPVLATSSVLTVCQILARNDVRRIPVLQTNDNANIIDIITESQVVRWLHKNIPFFELKSRKFVSQCAGLLKPVISTTYEATTMDAMELMVTDNISGVAVVNADGQLSDDLSIHDLQLIGIDCAMLWRLNENVRQFIDQLDIHHQQQYGRPRTLTYVTTTATIAQVIDLLIVNKTHRCYIVDDETNKHTIGLCGITDVIRQMMEE